MIADAIAAELDAMRKLELALLQRLADAHSVELLAAEAAKREAKAQAERGKAALKGKGKAPADRPPSSKDAEIAVSHLRAQTAEMFCIAAIERAHTAAARRPPPTAAPRRQSRTRPRRSARKRPGRRPGSEPGYGGMGNGRGRGSGPGMGLGGVRWRGMNNG